jgi:hypothetical protein
MKVFTPSQHEWTMFGMWHHSMVPLLMLKKIGSENTDIRIFLLSKKPTKLHIYTILAFSTMHIIHIFSLHSGTKRGMTKLISSQCTVRTRTLDTCVEIRR